MKIFTVLLAVMLIIGVASAAKIEKVKLVNQGNPNTFDVIVGVQTTDTETIKEVNTNSNQMNYNSGVWKKEGLGDEILTIQAKNGQGNVVATEVIGHGGCTGSYGSHQDTYNFANVRQVLNTGSQTTFYLDTYSNTINPEPSIIGICIYPINGFNADNLQLHIATPLLGLWLPKLSGNNEYFGFGRKTGQNNIPASALSSTLIGTANQGASSRILMHIYDPTECSKGDTSDDTRGGTDTSTDTCWRRPGTPPPGIPEFPTVALPIAAVIGLVFFFQNRKKKEE